MNRVRGGANCRKIGLKQLGAIHQVVKLTWLESSELINAITVHESCIQTNNVVQYDASSRQAKVLANHFLDKLNSSFCLNTKNLFSVIGQIKAHLCDSINSFCDSNRKARLSSR